MPANLQNPKMDNKNIAIQIYKYFISVKILYFSKRLLPGKHMRAFNHLPQMHKREDPIEKAIDRIRFFKASRYPQNDRFIEPRRLIESKTANPDILAYLWLALENDMNIIINGRGASGKTSLLTALSGLSPMYQTTVTIVKNMDDFRFYDNFANIVPKRRYSNNYEFLSASIPEAISMNPGRIVIDDMEGNTARKMFNAAVIGIPFLATMHWCANCQDLEKKLVSKPMLVESNAIAMLDISILIKQNDLTHRRIESIKEYRWLSRSEMDYELADQRNNGLVINEIASSSELNQKELENSKVFDSYSKIHYVGKKETIKEFEKRKEFLSRMLLEENSGIKPHKYIEKYLEIKSK